MSTRCPKAKSLGKVILPNHSLAFKGVCDITQTTGVNMECALWTISKDCEKSLDALEGYPFMYDKKQVVVRYNNQKIHAMIYYMTPGAKLAVPGKYYLDMVTNGYKDHDMDVDQIYEALEAVYDTVR
jgi:gamma-glutamylcyclotransferase (GGCT)/AIG2-like uncharacterized protein YtfP